MWEKTEASQSGSNNETVVEEVVECEEETVAVNISEPIRQSEQQTTEFGREKIPQEPVVDLSRPKWMRSCARRGSPIERHTNLKLGPDSQSRPTLTRIERSISSSPQEKQQQHQSSKDYNFFIGSNHMKINGMPEKSAASFKRPQVSGTRYVTHSNKKTTFALGTSLVPFGSRMSVLSKISYFAPTNSFGRRLVADKSKSRNFLMPTGFDDNQTKGTKISSNSATTLRPLPMAVLETRPNEQLPLTREEAGVKKLANNLLGNDIKMTWLIGNSLNTTRNSINSTMEIIRALKSRESAGHKLDPTRSETIRRLSEWLPKIDQLITGDVPKGYKLAGGLFSNRTRDLVRNMSHYFEFYSVALEQMVFEQEIFRSNLTSSYKQLESNLLSIECGLDSIRRLSELHEIKRRELRMMISAFFPKEEQRRVLFRKIGESTFFHELLLGQGGDLKRDHNLPDSINFESPLVKYLNSNNHSSTGDRYSINILEQTEDLSFGLTNEHNWKLLSQNMCTKEHAGREVMPLEQRRLKSHSERAHRDLVLLGRLTECLSSYMSLLKSNLAS